MLELEDAQEPIGRDEPVEPSLGVDDGDAAASASRRRARGRLEVGFGQNLRRLFCKLADARVWSAAASSRSIGTTPDEAPVVEQRDLGDARERAAGKRRSYLARAGVGSGCRHVGTAASPPRLGCPRRARVGHMDHFAAAADNGPLRRRGHGEAVAPRPVDPGTNSLRCPSASSLLRASTRCRRSRWRARRSRWVSSRRACRPRTRSRCPCSPAPSSPSGRSSRRR